MWGSLCTAIVGASRPSYICGSGRRKRSVDVREHDKNLIEAGNLENGPHVFLHASQDKFPAVGFYILHCFDQGRESGTIDVGDAREIDYQARGFLFGERAQGRGHARRDVKIDFAFQRQNVGFVG
jgi:GNAT superfamily N-acetyltransferase